MSIFTRVHCDKCGYLLMHCTCNNETMKTSDGEEKKPQAEWTYKVSGIGNLQIMQGEELVFDIAIPKESYGKICRIGKLICDTNNELARLQSAQGVNVPTDQDLAAEVVVKFLSHNPHHNRKVEFQLQKQAYADGLTRMRSILSPQIEALKLKAEYWQKERDMYCGACSNALKENDQLQSQLTQARASEAKMEYLIKWIGDYVCTAKDGGEAWCSVRNNEGAVEWAKKLRVEYERLTTTSNTDKG